MAFQSEKDVKNWLKNKPPEMCIVIAARAVLRVLPGLATAPGGRTFILPAFRAAAAPWVASQFPTHRAELSEASGAAADTSRAAADASRAAAGSDVVYAAAAAPADVVFAAAYAAAAASRADAFSASAAIDYAVRACGAYVAGADVVYAADVPLFAAYADVAVSSDVNALDNGMVPAELAGLKLWPGNPPTWVAKHWERLRASLLNANENWQVWTNWYEQRLVGTEGGPPNEVLEVARVLIPEPIWRQGPLAVNTEIKRLIEEHSSDAIPSQVPQALVFGGADDAPIDQVDPPGRGLNDSPDQRQSHADLRDKAQMLESACGDSNRLAVLRGYASKLVIAAGDTLLELRVRAFWSQMNSLRRRHEADVRARESADPDSPPLPEEAAGVLHDLVETLNVFAAHEPKLVALDDVKRDPADRVANHATLSAARQIADAALNAPHAVKPEAANSLAQATGEAIGESPSAERSKEFATKSARNLVLEAIRRAYKMVSSEAGVAWKGMREGAYRTGGAGMATYGAALLIKANEAAVHTLIDTLGGASALHKIVDLIVKALS